MDGAPHGPYGDTYWVAATVRDTAMKVMDDRGLPRGLLYSRYLDLGDDGALVGINRDHTYTRPGYYSHSEIGVDTAREITAAIVGMRVFHYIDMLYQRIDDENWESGAYLPHVIDAFGEEHPVSQQAREMYAN